MRDGSSEGVVTVALGTLKKSSGFVGTGDPARPVLRVTGADRFSAVGAPEPEELPLELPLPGGQTLRLGLPKRFKLLVRSRPLLGKATVAGLFGQVGVITDGPLGGRVTVADGLGLLALVQVHADLLRLDGG